VLRAQQEEQHALLTANVRDFTPLVTASAQADETPGATPHILGREGRANNVAIDYSTAQQLLTTAWNQIVAIVLVCWVFGCVGGKQLVGQSYTDAKIRVADMKTERQQKKADKRKAKQADSR
jgi:hypothetical protein